MPGQQSAGRRQAPVLSTREKRDRLVTSRLFAAALLCACAGLAGLAWIWLYPDPIRLRVAADREGTAPNTLMKEISQVVARNSETVRLDVVAADGPEGNLALLSAGKVDLATIRADTENGDDAAGVATLFSDYFHLIVDDLIPAFRVDDLRRLRVVIPPFGSRGFKAFWLIADPDGLSLNSLDWAATELDAAIEGLLSGQHDALFTIAPLRDPALLDLFERAGKTGRRLRYMPIHRSEVIAAKWAFLRAGSIAPGEISDAAGIPGHQTTTNLVSHFLVAHEAVAPEAVQDLTAVLFNHRSDLEARRQLGAAIREPGPADIPSGKRHEGADLFFAGNEPAAWRIGTLPMALAGAAGLVLIAALFVLWRGHRAGRPGSADSYNDQVFEIESRIGKAGAAAELIEIRVALDRILEAAVIAYDEGDVTEGDFQAFRTFVEKVRESVRRRQTDLVQLPART